MFRFRGRSRLTWLRLALILAASAPACYPDVVPGVYGYGDGDDAGADSASADPSVTATATPTATTTATSTAPEAGTGSEAASNIEPDAASNAPAGPCDLTGRWIASDHQVLDGLSVLEAAHVWYYLELTQSGSAGAITRALDCGENVSAISPSGANETCTKAWPAYQSKVGAALQGVAFTSTTSGSGCAVSFKPFYTVIGATVPYYLDPSRPLPDAGAAGSSPGWEDWDHDGNPGVTQNSTGLVVGALYLSARRGSSWSGKIAASATTFKLTNNWIVEQFDFGYSPSSAGLLTSQAGKYSDQTTQFIELARLSASQATGNDDSVCSAIRTLAPTLTPSGAGN
jgi:hypothetical protein